jgi:hypothetical protein
VLDWEVGDVTAWVSLDQSKPFPVTIYKKGEQWQWDAHQEGLTDKDRIQIEAFVKDILQGMNEQFRPNMKRRLLWDTAKIRRKKK